MRSIRLISHDHHENDDCSDDGLNHDHDDGVNKFGDNGDLLKIDDGEEAL